MRLGVSSDWDDVEERLDDGICVTVGDVGFQTTVMRLIVVSEGGELSAVAVKRSSC